MSITLVNNHVLFPHAPNWEAPPEWRRRWESEVSGAVTGHEARQALRTVPRRALSWAVTPWTAQEENALEDRIRAASKSGLACTPYWGRGTVLASDCTGTAVGLAADHWSWTVGDHIFLLDATDSTAPVFNVRQISALTNQQHFTLGAVVSRTFAAGLMVWPLLFGKLRAEGLSQATACRAGVRLRIEEQISPASVPVGEVMPPAGIGIGVMAIGTTFTVHV